MRRRGVARRDDGAASLMAEVRLPRARGRGLAQAAVELMMRSVLGGLGLRSVVLDIEAGNEASLRLAGRLGAERRVPTRVEVDRAGTPRTLIVHVLPVPRAVRRGAAAQ